MELQHHQRYVIEEFAEAYQERRLNRRDLLRRVLLVTGSVPATASVLFALGCGDSADDGEPAVSSEPTAAPVQTTAAGIGPGVPENDPAIEGGMVRFPGPASEMLGYVARPKAPGSYPGVVIYHENQGLQDHFKDVARRFAKEGFAALAPDLVSRLGGTTPDDPGRAMTALRLDINELRADMLASVGYLKSQTFVRANALAAMGFCAGGGYTWETAVASPDIRAAAPFYGSVSAPLMERLGETRAAILAVYGETDTRITGQSGEVADRLRAARKTVEVKIYPGAPHAFFNDTRPNVYNEQAAKDAWRDTLAWFRRHLTA